MQNLRGKKGVGEILKLYYKLKDKKDSYLISNFKYKIICEIFFLSSGSKCKSY